MSLLPLANLQTYASRIEKIETRFLVISDKTTWLFIELHMGGRIGRGEATLPGRENEVINACQSFAKKLNSGHLSAFLSDELKEGPQQKPPVLASALSALEQALLDIDAQEQNLPLSGLINPQSGPLNTTYYANINRGVIQRTPEAFARAAEQAVAKGYPFIKFAPFDGIDAGKNDTSEFKTGLDHAAACIEAVHHVTHGKARFMVDCHSRFNLATATQMLDRIRNFAPYWIEEAIPERPDTLEDCRKFRELANSHGIKIAGLETIYGLNRFKPFIDAHICDVILPDLRWCGGIREFIRIAEAVREAGQSISLHNPSGPVLNALSLQVARAMPDEIILESQFNESPAFFDIIAPGETDWRAMPNLPALTIPGLGLELSNAAPWDAVTSMVF